MSSCRRAYRRQPVRRCCCRCWFSRASAGWLPLAQDGTPRRIISFIPAVTEMLFALGAGDRVVAVGSFDKYPPEVEKLPRVGALLDPDLERILSLRPDLVVVYGSQTDLRTQLERAKVPIYVYSHAGLADVTTTILELGARVGRERARTRAGGEIEREPRGGAEARRGQQRPRTLIVFGRESWRAARHLRQRRLRLHPRHGHGGRRRQRLRGPEAAGRPGDNGADPRAASGRHPRAARGATRTGPAEERGRRMEAAVLGARRPQRARPHHRRPAHRRPRASCRGGHGRHRSRPARWPNDITRRASSA